MSRTASVKGNAQVLRDSIPGIKEQFGVKRVNVVAHSKGGLDISQYLQWRHDVATQVTLGTPYRGIFQDALVAAINLAGYPTSQLLLGSNALGWEFLSVYRNLILDLFWHPSRKTRYVTRAGVVTIGSFELHTDWIVPEFSANGLPSSYSPSEGTIVGDNAEHWNLTYDDISAQNIVNEYLADPNYTYGHPLNTSEELASNFGAPSGFDFFSKAVGNSVAAALRAFAIDSTQHTSLLVDQIDQTETNSHVISIDPADGVYFVTGWSDGVLDVTLTDPNNTQIDSAAAANDPDMAYITFFDSLTGIRHANYLINYPGEGEWTVDIDATDVPSPGGSSYFIQGSLLGPDVSLAVQTDRPYYKNGESVTITATLTELGGGIGNASVVAKLAYPDSTVQTVSLPVKSKPNGVYEVTLSNLTQPMLYGVEVTATGSIGHGQNQVDFSRAVYTMISMAATGTEFTGSNSDTGVDTDSDGLFDLLKIQIGVDVASSGEYAVRGKLTDSNGDLLGYARADTSLSSGSQIVQLFFDGRAIYKSHLDGPYMLSDVVLAEVDSLTLLLDEFDSPYSTQSYDYSDFQHSSVSIYDPYLWPKDTDQDGIYNQLNARFYVDSEINTDCSFTGALMDPEGNLVDQVERAVHFFQDDVGVWFYLLFDGWVINHRGLDGPYSVDLYYSCNGGGPSGIITGIYETANFSYSDFGTPADVRWSSAFDTLGLDGTVRAIAIGASGEIYVGGDFSTAGSVTVNHVAKYENGSWSALGGGTNAPVYSLSVASGGDLYVGGKFTMADTVATNYIARWDGTEWSSLGIGTSYWVFAIDLDGSDNVYAGGPFTSAGGTTVNRIAKWDGSGWSALGSGLNATPYAVLHVGSGQLFVGGDFTSAGGVSAQHVAKWTGTGWTAVGSGIGGTVYSLTKTGGGFIFAGGEFLTTGAGALSLNISVWDNAQWKAPAPYFNPSGWAGVDGPVHSVFAAPGTDSVYTGGEFDRTWGANGVLHGVGIFGNYVNAYWRPLGSGVYDTLDALTVRVRAVAVDGDGNAYVGGEFDHGGHKPSYYFGVFESQTASKVQVLHSGWNSLANTNATSVSIEKLLASVSGSVKVAQNELGSTYWPEFGVNDIGILRAGETYRLYLEARAAVPERSASAGDVAETQPRVETVHYTVPPLNLDNSSVVLVLSDLADGDEVAVRTEAGELVGSAVVHDGKAGITLWGETRPETRGASEGEALALTAWSVSRQSEIPLETVRSEAVENTEHLVFVSGAVETLTVTETVVPTSFELYANYPNPFSTRTTIRFDVAEEGKVSLEVFNVMGQRVASLVNGVKRPGSYAESFEADQVSSGIYFVRFETHHAVMTKRMIVVK